MEMTDHTGPPAGQQDTRSPAGMAVPQNTRPQLFAVTLLTVLALAVGVFLAALGGDLSMTPKSMQSGMKPGISRSAAPSSPMAGMSMKH